MKVYQYSNGEYLPDSSQPQNTVDYAIASGEYTPHEMVRFINVTLGKNGIAARKNVSGQWLDMQKQLPMLYEGRENCCGCTACFAGCPVQAIAMRPDEEGFLYPVVDAGMCVRCYKCLSVCAFQKILN